MGLIRRGANIVVVIDGCGSWFPKDVDRSKMVDLQREIAEEAVWEGTPSTERVAGVDQAFDGDTVVSAAVVLEDGHVVDSSVVHQDTRHPYVPGLLAFREGSAAMEAVTELEVDPDVLLVDGSGRIHPRQAGLATHLGVALDVPAVGVAKSLLCGEPRRPVDGLEEGERVAVLAGDDVEASADEVIGYAYQSRQYSGGSTQTVNPLYVSPGHGLDAEAAVDVVAECCLGYKIPEPVREADALAGRRS